MADDVLAHLGLDAKDFKNELKTSTAHAKYLEDEARKLDAAIKLLEKTFRANGGATGAQTAQVNQLRQALKATQSDYKRVTAEAKAFENVNKKPGDDEKKSTSGGGGRQFFNIAAVAGLLYKLGDSITKLGERATAAIDKFQAGGSRLGAQSGNRGDAALSVGLNPIVEDATAGFANKIGAAALQGLAAIAKGLNKMFKIDSLDDFVKGVEAVRAEGEEELKVREQIAATEDDISDALRTQTADINNQNAIITKQIALEEEKLKLANLTTVQGRQQANQAKSAIGALKLQMDSAQFSQRQAAESANAETTSMRLKQQGMKNVAEMVKTESDYRIKIQEAQRVGNSWLVEELKAQQALAAREGGAREHNLSPAELRNERREARKLERDVNHEAAREADMADRIARGAFDATKGGRMDRFIRRQQARRNAGNAANMTINQMTVATINVASFKVNIP